eukprot:scaffold109_cov368-Pavlova_lutheri.AAC.13
MGRSIGRRKGKAFANEPGRIPFYPLAPTLSEGVWLGSSSTLTTSPGWTGRVEGSDRAQAPPIGVSSLPGSTWIRRGGTTLPKDAVCEAYNRRGPS